MNILNVLVNVVVCAMFVFFRITLLDHNNNDILISKGLGVAKASDYCFAKFQEILVNETILFK